MSTFVLIHGGGDVAWSWHLLETELRERGHGSVAVELPIEDAAAGLTEYADAVVAAVGDRTELVVVGHSLGCFTAPLVCERLPVELLVLAAGMIPAPGETAMGWWEDSGHAQFMREHPRRDDSTRAIFLHDVPPQLAAEALARGRDQSGTPMHEPWPLTAWPDVPTRYLLFREDRVFPAEFARGHARERLGIAADEIGGGHCAMLSRPGELADRLVAYLAERDRRAA
jgi:pimeloyl-ACP methyl ester carboxylesterase